MIQLEFSWSEGWRLINDITAGDISVGEWILLTELAEDAIHFASHMSEAGKALLPVMLPSDFGEVN